MTIAVDWDVKNQTKQNPRLVLSIVKVKPMFKQHMNLKI